MKIPPEHTQMCYYSSSLHSEPLYWEWYETGLIFTMWQHYAFTTCY